MTRIATHGRMRRSSRCCAPASSSGNEAIPPLMHRLIVYYSELMLINTLSTQSINTSSHLSLPWCPGWLFTTVYHSISEQHPRIIDISTTPYQHLLITHTLSLPLCSGLHAYPHTEWIWPPAYRCDWFAHWSQNSHRQRVPQSRYVVRIGHDNRSWWWWW